jgi:8-oxo-dGTP diphosphatase
VTEAEFLERYDPDEYERLSVAVDVVVLTAADGALRVLLVQRDEHPHRGRWALPGGFVRPDQSLDDAASEVLDRKAALRGVFLEQLYTFGAPDRDPRTRVISVAYYALVDAARLSATAEVRVSWTGEAGGPAEVLVGDEPAPLAFDHADVLGLAVKRLRGKLDYSPVGFQLLGERFTLRDLQQVHETVLGRRLNKDSFRRRMLASGQLQPTGDRESDVAYRPAELYRFRTPAAI